MRSLAPSSPSNSSNGFISPNLYAAQGLTDSQKITQAIALSRQKGVPCDIPAWNEDRQQNLWLIDEAILVYSNTTLYIGGIVRLSDSSRDNIIRSANVGIGISQPVAFSNIHIEGYGGATLQGADNPRATGDSGKTLSATAGVGATVSYGTDALNPNEKQTGDWRNVGVIIAYADNVRFCGFRIERTHAWSTSFERVTNFAIHDLFINNPTFNRINNVNRGVLNRDGVDIRFGCKNGRIYNITGDTGDDLVALTGLPGDTVAGGLFSTIATGPIYRGAVDDIEQIDIFNITGSSFHSIIRLSIAGIALMRYINVRNVTVPAGRLFQPNNIILAGYQGTGALATTPKGNLSCVTIDNIKSFSSDRIISIIGSLADSTIQNVVTNLTTYFYYKSGHKGIGNVYTANLNGSLPEFMLTTPTV